MKRLRLFLVLVLCSSASALFAQNIKIEGAVIDQETKEPLIGATLHVKGTNKGTVTDVDGKFSLSVTPGSTLNITYLGYTAQELVASKEGTLRIALTPSNRFLQEAIVVGYGTQKAKDMTAPISNVKGADLNKQITANPMSALQGKMPGVQIINSGAPGAGPSVKIRGLGSIGDYANPLYVVDGVFVDNIDFLSSSDIEELTVLKDASAAAIYGVRAANGVILITTKKGKTDAKTITYDGYAGVQVPTNVMKLANAAQYVELLNEANANVSGYIAKDAANYPASTDWYSELLRNALMHSHSIDISGANDQTNYSAGVNYFYQDGIMDAENNYERLNFRGRLDQKVNDRITLGFNTVISNYTKHNADNDAFFQAFVNPPVYGVYDETNTAAYPVKFGSAQSYGFGNQYGNPVARAYYNNNQEKGLNMIFSTSAEFNLIPSKLKFKTSYNMRINAAILFLILFFIKM